MSELNTTLSSNILSNIEIAKSNTNARKNISDYFIDDFDLSLHNTMALSCQAKQAIILEDEQQVEALFEYLNIEKREQRILILSGGSNVILPSLLNAVVILPQYTGVTILADSLDSIDIEVMAGNNWHELVVECTEKGWYGLENLALIPGLVGASPVQNIGAYGRQLEDCIIHVKAYHIPTQTWYILSKEECQFSYRDSLFKKNPNTWLISRVAFRLHKDSRKLCINYGDVELKSHELAQLRSERDYLHNNVHTSHTESNQNIATVTPVDVMNAIIRIRQSKLPNPKELANAGSFFKNPIIKREQYNDLLLTFDDMPKYDISETEVKIPAGWLIDKAGLKGKGVEPIVTHKKQALVLTNHSPFNAIQDDITKACDLIINTVLQRYGITLCPEPIWIKS